MQQEYQRAQTTNIYDDQVQADYRVFPYLMLGIVGIFLGICSVFIFLPRFSSSSREGAINSESEVNHIPCRNVIELNRFCLHCCCAESAASELSCCPGYHHEFITYTIQRFPPAILEEPLPEYVPRK